MAYEVLALKYRPAIFEDLVGQEAVARTLTNAIQQNRIAHAFLFSGVRGVGKTTTARILAKALNCVSGPTIRPCGECPPCKEIARGGAIDVLEIDGASNNGVEQVREIVEAARYAPSRDRFKIYIIDEVHMLTQAAFNALLKTLEEPPRSVKFIFATTEHHKIPDTILSRCQEFEFRTVSPAEISEQLKKIANAEGIEISESALAMIARAAEGSLRDGISALDQVIAASGSQIAETDVTELLGLIERDVLRETTRAIVERDTAAILEIVDRLVRGGRDLRYFASALMQYLRDVLVVRVAPHAAELLEIPAETADLAKLAQALTEEDLLRSLDVLTQVETDLRTAPEPRFHLEIALLKISQLGRLATFEELLERFEAIAAGGPPPSTAPAGAANVPKKRERSVSRKATMSETEALEEAPAPRSPTSVDEAAFEAPPMPEAEPAASGELELLPSLVERLKKAKPMLHALVARHERAEVDSGRLTLVYAAEQRVLAEQLQQKELKEVLEAQASEVAGRKLSVAVEVLDGRGDPTETPGSKPPPGPDGQTAMGSPAETGPEDREGEPPEDAELDLRSRAERDPLVRRFLETFQGEIKNIRRTEKA